MIKDSFKERDDFKIVNIMRYMADNKCKTVRTTLEIYVVDESNFIENENELILFDCFIPGAVSLINKVTINKQYLVSVEE